MTSQGRECEVSLTVNGRETSVRAYPMERLLDVLRNQLNLTGAKEGCGEGECGSCSVLMDGALVNSCLVPVLQAQGANIITIEGLAQGSELVALQRAFLETGGGIEPKLAHPHHPKSVASPHMPHHREWSNRYHFGGDRAQNRVQSGR